MRLLITYLVENLMVYLSKNNQHYMVYRW